MNNNKKVQHAIIIYKLCNYDIYSIYICVCVRVFVHVLFHTSGINPNQNLYCFILYWQIENKFILHMHVFSLYPKKIKLKPKKNNSCTGWDVSESLIFFIYHSKWFQSSVSWYRLLCVCVCVFYINKGPYAQVYRVCV